MKSLRPIFLLTLLASSTPLLAEQWQIQKRIEPKYPINAAKNNQEGCVNLQYFVNADGVPTYIEPLKSSTQDIFDSAAIEALSQWQYTPTESNPKRLPQRKTVQLSFAMSPDSDILNKCFANMTIEPEDIQTFRDQRLSSPIVANDLASWKNALTKITTVLSSTEIDAFSQSYASLLNTKSGMKNNEVDSFLTVIDGLNYYQILALAEPQKPQNNDSLNQVDTSQTQELPAFVNMQQFFKTWEISDLAIHMESNLYKEISYRLLKIELLINNDGTAKLLSTCRAVSEEMRAALQASVSDWQITNKVQSPKASRYIYGVPAPIEAGAHYQCNDEWYPNHKLAIPLMQQS